MKSFKNLYDIITPEFCELQIHNASKHKESRWYVKKVLDNPQYYAKEIYELLQTGEVNFQPHIQKVIYDPHSKKTRTLLIPVYYPDHIICWCYVQMMQPVFTRGMYTHTYSSIPGRGLDKALKQVKSWIEKDRFETQYVAEADIHKCYNSIDQEVLLQKLKRVVKDPRAIKLSESVIHSVDTGLPIGDYPSPWLTNFYLQEVDHLIKERYRIPYYIRYADNLVMFSHSKEQLRNCLSEIEKYLLDTLHLEFNPSKQVYPLESRGLDFLGLVFHPGYTKLRARNFLAFTRQARDFVNRIDTGREISLHESISINCRLAMVKRCNYYNILEKYYPPEYDKEVRKICSKMMRRKDHGLCVHQ